MIDVSPAWGSHVDVLESELEKLEPGSLVVEHGVGVYSTPLIARHRVRVILIDELDGWRRWAHWLYTSHGRATPSTLDRAKRAVPELKNAALVFIDGAMRERGDMLTWSLAARVPVIVAHDTEDDRYGWQWHLSGAYAVDHHGDCPRTTVWRLS